MGWAVGYDSRWKRDIGYGVPAYCDFPGCGQELNRGLSYVCCGEQPHGGDGCGLYFCPEHMEYSAALDAVACPRCNEGAAPYEPTVDHPDWIQHKLTDESWQRWRDENPDEVTHLLARP